MINKKEKAIFAGFLASILISFSGFSSKCEDLSSKVLRLHVIANSNTQQDQGLKLKVRDRILDLAGEIFQSAEDVNKAIENVNENLYAICREAEDEIKENGYNYKVKAQILKMHFKTRKYDNFTMPAGSYNALRVTIGEGKGENWWCIMFPPVCISASQDKKELQDVLNPEELDIAQGGEKYDIKFKFVEIFEEIRQWVHSIFCFFS